MEKYGLVLEGGGLRGAYTAGALKWLADHNLNFQYNCGISSGCAYIAMHVANRDEISYDVSTNYAVNGEAIGIKALLREGHYVAGRYVFHHLLGEVCNFKGDEVQGKGREIETGVYDLTQGKTIFFGAEDFDHENELIRAACSLPVASEVVNYKGHRLLDGGITVMIPIERAIEKGCTKTLVITTKPKDYVRKPASKIVQFLMRILYRSCPQIAKDYEVRHLNYYRQINIINDKVADGSALHIYPSVNIKVSRFSGDPEKCKELYKLGYEDMEARKEEVFAFMKDLND